MTCLMFASAVYSFAVLCS